VEDVFNFFNVEKSPRRKKTAVEYATQFLTPSVSYEKKVASTKVLLGVRLIFSPKQYAGRAKELLTSTQMTKTTKLYVQQQEKDAKANLKKDAKLPPALLLILHITDLTDFGFSSDVIPRILKVEPIKSNLEFLLSKIHHRSRMGFVCPTLRYDATKIRVIGGIIPTHLPLPKSISNRVGKSTLSSIGLGFEDSPIGLGDVTISKENGELTVATKIMRGVNNFKELHPKVLNSVREIVDLFLERVI